MNYQILPKKRYFILKGGAGSGHFAHAGRPGEVGGSDGGGDSRREGGRTGLYTDLREARNDLIDNGISNVKYQDGTGQLLSEEQSLMYANAIGSESNYIRNNFDGAKSYMAKSSIQNIIVDSSGSVINPVSNTRIGQGGWYINQRMAVSGAFPRGGESLTTGKFLSTNGGFNHNFRHELGHHIQERMGPAERGEWVSLLNSKGTGWAAANISLYGAMNSAESFSEAFAAFTSRSYGTGGNKLSKEVDSYMRKYIGKGK